MDVSKGNRFKTMKTTGRCADHDYDLVQELGHRLDAIWHYDEHIANAKGHDAINAYWTDVKTQDEDNVKRLKALIQDEIQKGCF